MPVQYSSAPEVERVAGPIIEHHHSHLRANAVKVVYLFTDKAEKKAGKVVLGTARKVTGLTAYLAEQDADDPEDQFFLICIWETWWRSRSTTDAQRAALVDHELCCCFSEEEVNRQLATTGRILLSMVPHDITEFNDVAARHGAWQPDIDAFLKAIEESDVQPGLFDEKEADEKEADEKEARADSARVTSVTISAAGRPAVMTPEDLQKTADRLHDRAFGRAKA